MPEVASTRRDWAVAQQNIRLEEVGKDCTSIITVLRDGELTHREAAYLLLLAIEAQADHLDELDQFVAGEPDA